MNVDFVIGEVLSAGVGSLSLQAEGLSLSQEDLYVNEALLPGYTPLLSGTLTGTGYQGASVTVPVKPSQLARTLSPLSAGDRVVLLTQDHQSYYLICKAVLYG